MTRTSGSALTFLCSIWDWSSQSRLNRFANGNPSGTRINEVTFINEDDQALLMTGSSDGVLRVFRNFESSGRTELVSAWRALTDLVDSNVNAGLVFDWQQGQGKALVAGDVKVIRIWNAATEMCTNVGLLVLASGSILAWELTLTWGDRTFPRALALASRL